MENNQQQSFWKFSDQLRVHTNNLSLSNLSLNDSIWSNNNNNKRPEERRNFDIRVGGDLNPAANPKLVNEFDFNSLWSTNSYASAKKPAEERRNFDARVGGELNGGSANPTSLFKQNESDFNGFNHGNLVNPSSVFKQNDSGFNPSRSVFEQNETDFNGFNYGLGAVAPSSPFKQNESDFNGFNHGWKINNGSDLNAFNDGWKQQQNNNNMVGLNNGGFNKGLYSKPLVNFNQNNNNNNGFFVGSKYNKGGNGKGVEDQHNNHHNNGTKLGKKNKNGNGNKDKDNGEKNNGVDKRFKTLPPSESLPRNETVGGYIFVCNNDTMEENLKRQLFGLPPRYRDSVRQITPGLPLFLYNYSTHQLHGVFEAASFGGTNIDPTAWEDKKNPGESRFPAQVRVVTRKLCEPLEEDSFRPILHHYDGPKFRLELNIPEVLTSLDLFKISASIIIIGNPMIN
ncbi:DCD domain-containing protein NRP isoform X1 [Rhododendron vialii]|uniref:DCD domain-containing protein NRP isoform X1 n=1 Tax=Rhododendron vialii TaxID=182163 RepID=UPI00265F5382|nr:DCD domain-containing protein NRP isoform X1 [Rhododendron vialii]